MDFVINNYLWFIIGAVVLLMIIIGYFAEKTNFGKIPLNSRKDKKEKNVEEGDAPTDSEAETIPMNQIGIADAVAPEEPINVSLEPTESKPTEVMPEEDLNVPFGDAKVEEPKEEVKSTPEVAEELPDIPEVPEAKKDEDTGMSDESEDDVWKF